MLPSLVAREVIEAVRAQLHAQFPSTTQGFLRNEGNGEELTAHGRAAIDDLLARPGEVFRGPYLSVGLPFRSASSDEPPPFSHLRLPFPPYRHQMRAYERLVGAAPQPTLVATGTGSGKTECFLYPLLEHCAAMRGRRGVKALVVYPMNALAQDQARRFAEEVHKQPALKGQVRVGLYTGDSGRGGGSRLMGKHTVITDRRALQDDPPDILLTNYKMLDFLLIRPRDQQLWRFNEAGTLRYLVVDELHTFDGAQGTDLACLVRRLRDRLDCGEELACVGTSATVGDDADALTEYASKVFATRFGPDAVLREERLTAEEFLPAEPARTLEPDADAVRVFAALEHASSETLLDAASRLWLGEALPEAGALGGFLRASRPFRDLLERAVDIVDLADVVAAHARRWQVTEAEAASAVDGLVALISHARAPNDRPWVTVRAQLWLRELRRMVATVAERPEIVFRADLAEDRTAPSADADEPGAITLPMIHCNDCHASGWVARKLSSQRELQRDPNGIYDAFFGGRPETVAIYPAAEPPPGKFEERRLCNGCGALHAAGRVGEGEWCPACADPNATLLAVVLPDMLARETRRGVERIVFRRDCPYCEASGSLLIVGSRAASLSAVAIARLQASVHGDDPKLIAFSDSVQDAAHRAGFFASRTWRSVVREVLAWSATEHEGRSLAELVRDFGPGWRRRLADAGIDDAGFVATFLAPDKQWRRDWETLRASGALPKGSNLLSDYVLPRLSWEALVAFGHESRRGRTLERTARAVVHPDPDALARAVDAVLPRVREDVAELRSIDASALGAFALGLLWNLRTRGAFFDPVLGRYLESGGNPYDLTNRRGLNPHLAPVGPASKLPRFLALESLDKRFDAIAGGPGAAWYRAWFDKTLAPEDVMASASLVTVCHELLRGLEHEGLLGSHEVRQHTLWSLRPESWRVSTGVATLVCDRCRHRVQVAEAERDAWDGLPCLRTHCAGTQIRLPEPERHRENADPRTPVRLVAAEHTAVLDADTRTATETSFKRDPPRPWDVNLLSATPTMEMGVDIGALSSVLLCSVPPAQANYLQRIGRAGRRDGNAFNLTIANGVPHDLFFYAEPLEMMRGVVQPPGVFLDAVAVLERQLVAYCFDRWAQGGIADDAIPNELRAVLDAVDAGSRTAFPEDFLAFVGRERARILREFLNLFASTGRGGSAGGFKPEIETALSDFLHGTYRDDGSRPGLVARLQGLFADRAAQRRRFGRDIDRLKREIERVEAQPQDEASAAALDELRAERGALQGLRKTLNRQQTLNFLTDEGILPNYAFPEDGVTLKSVIYRRVTDAESPDGGQRYENLELEIRRPAQVALRELAPFSRFYGNARQVEIDEVTLGGDDVQTWRLCPSCHHAEIVDGFDRDDVCPRCRHPGWGAGEQRMELLRLREVHARASDRDSRIGDDADDRDPVLYHRQFLFEVEDAAIERGWRLDADDCPFGFEYLSRASFREINFGRATDGGHEVSVAGRGAIRPGFPICRECGKVQRRLPKGRSSHARRCSWFARESDPDARPEVVAVHGASDDDDPWRSLHLYRELRSEAVRLLLPLADIATSEKRLESFTAALHLGLRERFRGNVDHLQVLAVDEPVAGSDLRRHYLVLFDSVPGGTGYLNVLLEEPASLRSALEAARDVMLGCRCADDPSSDGCYRCLYAYKTSYRQKDISRTSALETLALILERWDTLIEIEDGKTLAHTDVNRFFDSELERRFVEVLANVRGCTLERRQVEGKDGFELTVEGPGTGGGAGARSRAAGDKRPSVRWSIEPQVDLGEADGVALSCRPDFVLRCLSKGGRGALPIVLFADGFEYHAEKQGDDTVKRYAVMRSGRYRVWSLGWHDLPTDGDRRRSPLGQWFDQPKDRTMVDTVHDKAADALDLPRFANQPDVLGHPVFEQLLHYLADPLAATHDYRSWAFSRTFGLLDAATYHDGSTIAQRVGTWLPVPWQELHVSDEARLIGTHELEGVPTVTAVASVSKRSLVALNEHIRDAKRAGREGTRDAGGGRYDARPSEAGAVTVASGAIAGAAEEPADYTAEGAHPLVALDLACALRLDDGAPAGEAYRDQWRRFWAATNLLQFLPEFLPLSRTGIEQRVYARVIEDAETLVPAAPARDSAKGTGAMTDAASGGRQDAAWQAMLELTTEPAALEKLIARGAPVPDDVGIDHAIDGVVVAILEWCWTAQRVALVEPGDGDDAVNALAADGWRAVGTTDDEALGCLHDWLREAEG